MPIDSAIAPEAEVLAIEVAENSKRWDYTPAQVQAAAERLRARWYTNKAGRPRAGEEVKPLIPALAVAFRVDSRTIQRALVSTDELSAPAEVGAKEIKAAIKALRRLEELEPENRSQSRLITQLPKWLDFLEQVLDDF